MSLHKNLHKDETLYFSADREERLDRFLARVLPEHSRTKLTKHIEQGGVLVDGKKRKPSFLLQPGMTAQVSPLPKPSPHRLEPIPMPIDVLYEDEYLLVVNKPAGISVHPSPTSKEPTLVQGLLARIQSLSSLGGSFRPGIVHRLDKDTSGLLLVAKNDFIHRALQEAIQQKRIQRIYRVWVRGSPPNKSFTLRSYLGRHPKHRQKRAVVSEHAPDARLAITHCKVLQTIDSISELECTLETGRTHQIRVQLASAGFPVLGDPIYGVSYPGLDRMALHAWKLIFIHPVTKKRIEIESPLPDYPFLHKEKNHA
ncbi:MAG TPA: RluA family pseudouridine synthase [Fimbriimonadales bacterium]|nr:RluA family pseudouridine synthase [Fimbriimonadales bacterium]